MKSYETHLTEFNTGKEYTRDDIKALLEDFRRYNDTVNAFIGQNERIFLLAGEICGYNAQDVCKRCSEEKNG